MVLSAFFGVSLARKRTVAFISGRNCTSGYLSGLVTCTFTWTVAFCRFASGEICAICPSYSLSG